MPESSLLALLESARTESVSVVDYDLTRGDAVIFDFTAANTNVTSRNVSIRSNVSKQLSHKGLAKMHDFIV